MYKGKYNYNSNNDNACNFENWICSEYFWELNNF